MSGKLKSNAASCDSCKFYKAVSPAHSVGICQRHAPDRGPRRRGLVSSNDEFSHYFDTNSDWPQVRQSDWCGDWIMRIGDRRYGVEQ